MIDHFLLEMSYKQPRQRGESIRRANYQNRLLEEMYPCILTTFCVPVDVVVVDGNSTKTHCSHRCVLDIKESYFQRISKVNSR